MNRTRSTSGELKFGDRSRQYHWLILISVRSLKAEEIHQCCLAWSHHYRWLSALLEFVASQISWKESARIAPLNFGKSEGHLYWCWENKSLALQFYCKYRIFMVIKTIQHNWNTLSNLLEYVLEAFLDSIVPQLSTSNMFNLHWFTWCL